MESKGPSGNVKEPYQHHYIPPLKEMEEVEVETAESEVEEVGQAAGTAAAAASGGGGDAEEDIEEQEEQPVFVNSRFSFIPLNIFREHGF